MSAKTKKRFSSVRTSVIAMTEGAPEPKPEQLSEYRTGYRDGLAQGIFDQQMDDAIKSGDISLTSGADGVVASESNLVECRCNCNPFCGCVCHKTGAEGAVKACGISVLSKSRGCFECALKEGHEGKHQPNLAEGAVKPDRDFVELERYFRKRGDENQKRAEKSDESWHRAKADTYKRCADKLAELLNRAPDQQEGSQ